MLKDMVLSMYKHTQHTHTQAVPWIKPWTLRVTGQCACTGPRCCPLQIYSEAYYWGWNRWQQGYEGDPRRKNTSPTGHSHVQFTSFKATHDPFSAQTCTVEIYTVKSVHFFLAQQAARLTVSIVSVSPHRMFGAMKSVKYTGRCMHACDTQLSISACSWSTTNISVPFRLVLRQRQSQLLEHERFSTDCQEKARKKSKLFPCLRVCLCRYADICQYEACVSFTRKTSRCRVLYICWKHFCGPPACA